MNSKFIPKILPESQFNFSLSEGSSKFSKISNTFLLLFSNKTLVSKAKIYKMLVNIANRVDPDQTGSVLFFLAFLAGN